MADGAFCLLRRMKCRASILTRPDFPQPSSLGVRSLPSEGALVCYRYGGGCDLAELWPQTEGGGSGTPPKAVPRQAGFRLVTSAATRRLRKSGGGSPGRQNSPALNLVSRSEFRLALFGFSLAGRGSGGAKRPVRPDPIRSRRLPSRVPALLRPWLRSTSSGNR